MKKIGEFIKDKIWLVLLAIHYVAMVFYENLVYVGMMDADIAADLLLAQSMAKNNEWILASDYAYTTEIHFLHTQLIEQILFRFTNNYRSVFVTSFAIWFLLVIIVCFLMIKKVTKSNMYASIDAMLLTGTGGTFYEFNFYTKAFITYILFSLIMICLYFKLYFNKEKNKNYWITIALTGILSFCMGAGGIRFFSLIIIPLVCLEIWQIFKANLHKEGINIDKDSIIRMVVITVPALIAYLLYKIPAIVNPYLVDANTTISNIITYIPVWLINCFGVFRFTGNELMSLRGIAQCFLIFTILIIYIVVIYFVIYKKRLVKDNNSKVVYLSVLILIFTFLTNVFYLVNTSLCAGDRERYLGIAIFLLLPLSVCCLYLLDINDLYKKSVLLIMLIFVFLFDVSKIKVGLNEQKQEPEYVSILEDKNYNIGWTTNFWESNIITAFSNGEIGAATYTLDKAGEDGWFYAWGTLKSYKDKSPEFLLCFCDELELEDIKNILDKYNLINEIYNDGSIVIYGA